MKNHFITLSIAQTDVGKLVPIEGESRGGKFMVYVKADQITSIEPYYNGSIVMYGHTDNTAYTMENPAKLREQVNYILNRE